MSDERGQQQQVDPAGKVPLVWTLFDDLLTLFA